MSCSSESIEEERRIQQRELEQDVVQFTRDWTETRHALARMENMYKDAQEQGSARAYLKELRAAIMEERAQLRYLVQASESVRKDLAKVRQGYIGVPTTGVDKYGMKKIKIKMVSTFERTLDEEVYDSTYKIEQKMDALKCIIQAAAADAVALEPFHQVDLTEMRGDKLPDDTQTMIEGVAKGWTLVDLLGLDPDSNDEVTKEAVMQLFERQVQQRAARHTCRPPKKHDKKYTCVVCMDMSDTGVLCDEQHFMCLACFSNYLDAEALNFASLRKRQGAVPCPNWSVTNCQSRPLDVHRIDEFVTDAIRKKAAEIKKRAEDVEAELKAYAGARSREGTSGDLNSLVRSLREEIEEDIMVLRCPRCRCVRIRVV